MVSNIKKNYIYNLTYQILLVITPFITTPYVSRVLQADGVGMNSYISAIVSYFVLLGGLGTATYGQRELSYLQNDRKTRSRVFWEIQSMTLLLYSMCIIVYFLFVFKWEQSNILFIIASLQILSSAFDIVWLFSALEEFRIVVLRNIFLKILSIVGVFCFVKTSNDLWLFMLINNGISFLGSISLWPTLKKYVDMPRFIELKPFSHLKGTLELFIPTIAIQIYVNVDKIMIGYLAGETTENGYYDQAQRIESMCLLMVTSLGTVLIPRIGACYKNNDEEGIKKIIYNSFRFAWMVSVPACLGIIVMADYFVPWFFGEGYHQVIYLLYIVSWIIIVIGMSNVIGTQYLIPTKQQKPYTKSVFLGMAVNIIFNILLIPKYLAIGAAIATLISELVVTTYQFYIVKEFFCLRRVWKESIHYWVAGIVMFVAVFFVKAHLGIGTSAILVCVGSGALVYVIALLGMKDSFFIDILGSVKNWSKTKEKK